jgi:hypothetical protein
MILTLISILLLSNYLWLLGWLRLQIICLLRGSYLGYLFVILLYVKLNIFHELCFVWAEFYFSINNLNKHYIVIVKYHSSCTVIICLMITRPSRLLPRWCIFNWWCFIFGIWFILNYQHIIFINNIWVFHRRSFLCTRLSFTYTTLSFILEVLVIFFTWLVVSLLLFPLDIILVIF